MRDPIRVMRVVAVLLGVVAVVRLLSVALDPEQRGIVLAAVLFTVLLVGGVVLGVARRVRRLADRVAELRPGAVVIPAYTTAETALEARALGVSSRKWNDMGGTPVVLAALPDRVEVWARGEDRPRWWVMRVAPFPPQAVRGSIGVRRPPSLRVVDGHAQVTVAPAYSAVRATFSGSQADLARAMTALGVPVTGF